MITSRIKYAKLLLILNGFAFLALTALPPTATATNEISMLEEKKA